ncbi:MAG: TetR/AcrR family transcriptional regulator [Mycobacteriales bacterium]
MAQDDVAEDLSGRSWREHAVARRLDPARARAETRVQGFLDAAFELLNESNWAVDFTVQDVVERSGQSLRSFYQYFGGKQELLLALFEETIVSAAEHLRGTLEPVEEPLERLHQFVIEYYQMTRQDRKRKSTTKSRPWGRRVMVEFAQQLLTAQPAEAARVFSPLVVLFEEILTEAVAAGAVRPELNNRRVAGTVLEAIMFNAFSATISGNAQANDPGEQLWDLLFHGLASQAST